MAWAIARVRSASTASRSGSASIAGRRLPALVLELGVRLDGAALAQPLGVHRGVDADPVQPRLDAAATELVEVAERREERLLDGIGRLVAIRHHPDDQREQGILVQHDEVVECIEVAGPGALDEDEVAALDGVVGDRASSEGPPRSVEPSRTAMLAT